MATTYPSSTVGGGARRSTPPIWLRIAALLGAVVYCVAISAYLLTHGGWPTPDYLIPPLLLAAVVLGRGPAFLADWGPFLLIILAWQVSAGVADQLGRPVHLNGPLSAERALFSGAIPTVALQRHLYDASGSTWYDWVGIGQHSLHFVLPVLIGFWLWMDSRRVYWRYLASVLVLFFFGFVTYALYPAAPPWMASMNELTPPIHRIAVETVQRLPASAPIGLVYTHMSPNTVAAIPSLHAALPLLIALVLIRVRGLWSVPTLLYPLVMGFFLVYLGEHYVIDVVIGYAYALAAYLLVWMAPWTRLARAMRVPRPVMPHLTVGPTANALGTALMPALAVASIVVIAFTLRPGRPSAEVGPLVPGLQVQAGDTGLLDPQPCDAGASPSLTAGSALLPVAGRYAAFLFDVEEPACFVLTANTQFSPPRPNRVALLASRSPIRLRPLPSLREGVEYFSVYAGYPSDQLQARGFPPDRRLALVTALSDVPDYDAAVEAVEYLASLALVVEPPAAPQPEVAPPEAPPSMPPSGG